MRAWLRLWILLFPLVSTEISAPAESPEGRGGLHYIYTDLNAQALRLILHSIFHMENTAGTLQGALARHRALYCEVLQKSLFSLKPGRT